MVLLQDYFGTLPKIPCLGPSAFPLIERLFVLDGVIAIFIVYVFGADTCNFESEFWGLWLALCFLSLKIQCTQTPKPGSF